MKPPTVRATRLPLALAAEVLGGYAAAAVVVALLARQEGSGAPSLAGVAFVVLASFALGRLLRDLEVDEARARLVGMAPSIVAVYFVAHTEYAPSAAPWDFAWVADVVTDFRATMDANGDVAVGGAALGGLWLRGLSRGQQTLDFDRVLAASMLGLAAVALATVTQPGAHGPEAWGAVALGFVVAALAALALYQAPDPERDAVAYAREFGGLLLVLPVGALALASLAAAIDPAAFGFLSFLGVPLRLLAVAIGVLLSPFIYVSEWLFRWLGLGNVRLQPQQNDQPERQTPSDQSNQPFWVRVLGWVAGGGFIALLLAAAMLAVWLTVRRFARGPTRPQDVVEDLERETTLLDDLRGLLAGLRRPSGARPSRSSVAIRRLYADVLDDAAGAGLPRPAAATPSQFAPRLAARYDTPATDDITAAYVAHRYGGRDVPPPAVEALRERWRSVSQPKRGETS